MLEYGLSMAPRAPRWLRAASFLPLLGLSLACSGGNMEISYSPGPQCSWVPEDGVEPAGSLRINEVMTGNDGAWVDEAGQTDDFVELYNESDEPVELRRFYLSDKLGEAWQLPNVVLAPGGTALVWADDTPGQGAWHLPFKLSSSGANVYLWSDSCELVDSVSVPELPRSESYARLPDAVGDFAVCRYATPEKKNGTHE